jgi:signal transduction histidine kinase/integral membrane sensor domain MASE1
MTPAAREPLIAAMTLRIGVVAAGYIAAGWLGVQLAIPPGYATAVWPPSGIALAAVLLGGLPMAIGVWLGSFIVNAFIVGPGVVPGELATLILPAAVAVGATAQALIGAALIRRFAGYSNLLMQEDQVVRILVLGGPVACLFNSTLSVTLLWLVGQLPPDIAAVNWWTWWIGDSIGVMVFAPLVLIWAVRPYQRWRRQQVFVSVPLVVLFAVVVAIFVFISRREQARIEEEFRGASGDLAQHLQEELKGAEAVLGSLEGFFATVDHVRQYQFEIFAGRTLRRLNGVIGLAWNPRVPAGERAGMERAAVRDGLDGYRITQLDADGHMVEAGQRNEYFPVRYLVPATPNRRALGFDIGSDATRRLALEESRDTAQIAVTGRINLVTDPGGAPGVLVVMPVYRHGMQPATVVSRRKYLDGYAVAAVDVAGLVATTVERAQAKNIQLALYDDAASGDYRLLFGEPHWPAEHRLSRSLPLLFAGRPWRLESWASSDVLARGRSWQTFVVLAGGLVLTAMGGVLLLLSVGRTARVEALVTQRTRELQHVNENLTVEVVRRQRLEAEASKRADELTGSNRELQRRDEINRALLHNLRQSENRLRATAAQLAASNRELEQFAYVTSHDLKAPLRSIASFAQLLEKRHKSGLDAEALEFLGFIRDGIQNMHTLIEDLLQLSRVDAKRLKPESVSLRQIVDRACKQISADLNASGAQLHVGELPVVEADGNMLVQLFQNLIGNAIKFQKAGHKPEVWIEAREDADAWQVSVRDNGIGIDPRHLEQIFLVFRRLHTSDQYPGTGIGLAICRKVVLLHGGDIWAESAPGKGTTMRFTLPKRGPVVEKQEAA